MVGIVLCRTDLRSQGHGLRNQCCRVTSLVFGGGGRSSIDVGNPLTHLWNEKPGKPLRINPVALIEHCLRSRAAEYLEASTQIKMEPSGSIFEYRWKLFFGALLRKISNQYQAAHRKVFGVRPNQRLQAR